MPHELLTPEQIAQLETLATAATANPYHVPKFAPAAGYNLAALNPNIDDAPTIESEARAKARAQILDAVIEIMAPLKAKTSATAFRSSEYDSASNREHMTRRAIADALRDGITRAIPRPSSPFSVSVRDVSEACANVKRWEYPTDKAAQTVGQWLASLDPWTYATQCAKVCYLAKHDPSSTAALVRALAHAITLERMQASARANIAGIFSDTKDERARDHFRIAEFLTPSTHNQAHPLESVRDAITRQAAGDLLLESHDNSSRLILETLKTHAPDLLEAYSAKHIRNEVEKARKGIAERLTQRHYTPTESALAIVFADYSEARRALKGENPALQNCSTWLALRKELLTADTLRDAKTLEPEHWRKGSAQAAHHLLTQLEQGEKPSTWQEIGQVFAANPSNARSRLDVIEHTKSRLAAYGLSVEKRAFVWNP